MKRRVICNCVASPLSGFRLLRSDVHLLMLMEVQRSLLAYDRDKTTHILWTSIRAATAVRITSTGSALSGASC